ncbi:MAG: hypothetical protein FJZ01_03450, partial [Candidatus Sericytochromatia bacterium]|nr:hypothetical protein [Candidatus Tanganyikabacteria bacterium]
GPAATPHVGPAAPSQPPSPRPAEPRPAVPPEAPRVYDAGDPVGLAKDIFLGKVIDDR